MDDPDADRRQFLAGAGMAAVVAVSGCLGGSADTNDSTTTTDTTTTTTTTAETTTETTEHSMSTVFHFSGAQSAQSHAVANVSNLLGDDSVDLGSVALVANGAGIKLLIEDESAVADDVQTLVDSGVDFYACHNSMQAFGATETDLIAPEIEVVPAGVGALTKLQVKEGYAYIKTP